MVQTRVLFVTWAVPTQNDGSIERSWGHAKGAARSPRRMETQPAWSGGGGTTFVSSRFGANTGQTGFLLHQVCNVCTKYAFADFKHT